MSDSMREALRRAEMKLRAYVGVCKDDKELPTVIELVQAALSQPRMTEEEAVDIMAEAHFNEVYPIGYPKPVAGGYYDWAHLPQSVKKWYRDEARLHARALLTAMKGSKQ